MKSADLFTIDNHVFKEILKQFDRTEETLSEDVAIVKNWMRTQPHLPEILDEARIQNFLFLNKFSIERTKQKIDMYYTIRSVMPDMYKNVNPEKPNMKKIMDIMYCVPLPKLTKEMYRVHVIKMRNKDKIGEMDPLDAFSHKFNVYELRLKEDCMLGDVLIFDNDGITWEYMVKATPTFLAKILAIYEKVYSFRMKAAYLINAPPFISTFMAILKTLMKSKLFQRIHIHQDASILHEHFPKEMLPVDYGGEEASIEDLHELVKLKFVEYKAQFDQFDKMRVDETLRPQKLKNDEVLGFHGNFKKLSVD